MLLNQYKSLFVIAITSLLICACIAPIASIPAPRRYQLYEFSKHQVHVKIMLEVIDDEVATLVTEFVPTDPTLHLYSKDLPVNGINGIGRPTLVTIKSGPLFANGGLISNIDDFEQEFPAIDMQFPIYPEGSVTLSQNVKYTNRSGAEEVTIAITYMACSNKGYCFPPVEEYLISSKIPDAFGQK